ncbi:MAG: hypothetical protein AB9891_03085 [Anaerolineaceae bacterium]
MTTPAPQPKNKRLMLIIVVPLVSCIISSMAGIFLGQIGNIFYKFLGESANCFSTPAFCGLFLVTFGLSFLCNKLLQKWLVRSGR